jgi:hypothetical protein
MRAIGGSLSAPPEEPALSAVKGLIINATKVYPLKAMDPRTKSNR